YCGHTQPMPSSCPQCGSPYIAPFGTGTQKLEQAARKMFPAAKILRMDADSTTAKGSYEQILSSFQKGEADILIGTQMIVKGHDFPKVTLVGIVAADLSLNTSEYDASERTFQLITQAAGRSGRGSRAGDVVIQSYDPSHYAVGLAAQQDYERFYEREMSFRRLLHYPPDIYMMQVRIRSEDEGMAAEAAELAAEICVREFGPAGAVLIGPCNESVYKINDNYRKILYIKHSSHDIIKKIRGTLEEALSARFGGRKVWTAFDIR
ncbi:MAG: primosomal protein N', partial [Lachnospiraceae bacterium]|nr:primosomal protein N' [Lachnospiraceae bacterium]